MSRISGTNGDDPLHADDNDTLASGDNSDAALLGGTDNDLFIVNWESDSPTNPFTAYISKQVG